MDNTRTKRGDWDRISMILRELAEATWIKARVYRVARVGGEWQVTFSTRQA